MSWFDACVDVCRLSRRTIVHQSTSLDPCCLYGEGLAVPKPRVNLVRQLAIRSREIGFARLIFSFLQSLQASSLETYVDDARDRCWSVTV